MAWNGKLDSKAVTGVLVKFRRGFAYRVLLEDDMKVAEMQHAEIMKHLT